MFFDKITEALVFMDPFLGPLAILIKGRANYYKAYKDHYEPIQESLWDAESSFMDLQVPSSCFLKAMVVSKDQKFLLQGVPDTISDFNGHISIPKNLILLRLTKVGQIWIFQEIRNGNFCLRHPACTAFLKVVGVWQHCTTRYHFQK